MFLRATSATFLCLLLTAHASGQSAVPAAADDETFVLPVKFAIYSSAWNARSDAGLRVVAQNQGEHSVLLMRLVFQSDDNVTPETHLALDMPVPALQWAERELAYVDLLAGSTCVGNTMQDDWKLVEISNYPLNPSVRGLIIEDTQSFRIYQCVRSARVHWEDQQTGEQGEHAQWLMYHFERRPRP